MTDPLLDVLEVLINAAGELHGWELMKESGRTGPTVYQTLDRLRNAGWVEYRWEEQSTETNRPRRRYYRLTAEGASSAKRLLAERRPRAKTAFKPACTPTLPIGPLRPDGA